MSKYFNPYWTIGSLCGAVVANAIWVASGTPLPGNTLVVQLLIAFGGGYLLRNVKRRA